MKVFFVSGSDTNVGKTYLTHHLAQTLNTMGIPTLALKPIETGVIDTPLDSLIHLQTAKTFSLAKSLEEVNLYSFALPASPFCADLEHRISKARLLEWVGEHHVEVLLVEGAGGLFVPIQRDYFMIDFAKDLQKRYKSKVIFVNDTRLGMLNRLMSAKYVLDSCGLETYFYLNLRETENFEKISLPFLQEIGLEYETQITKLAHKIR